MNLHSQLHDKIIRDKYKNVSYDDKIAYLRKRGHSERGIGYMDNAEIDSWYIYYHENPNIKSKHENMLERHKRDKSIKKMFK